MTTANEKMAIMLTRVDDSWVKLNPKAYHLTKNLKKFEDVIEVIDNNYEIVYYFVK